MVKARKWVVKKHFDGVPKLSDFEIVEYELPPLKDGEVLLKTEWVSVDPYLRAYNKNVPVPYDQFSFQVGVVKETRNPKFPVGTKVVTHKGWCDYVIVRETSPEVGEFPKELTYKLPDLQGLSPSLGVGAVGMPGVTAYFGFLQVCQPKAGETVVVTGAAGAVGSLVGQIAKIKGCRVIGFAGSDEKCKWLEKELGFDKALNYKKVDALTALKAAAPKGIDCYFDNVGGELSSTIISQMNVRGRVAVCGSISSYNDRDIPKASILQPSLVLKELRIEGFIIWRWIDRWSEGFPQLVAWIKSGQLKPAEHVTEGFDKLYDAFVGMLAGENTGKAVVKI
ncbi:prostaglandin reductase 1-like [Bicyclus anynana]|uniref:Prostaglandin reductase 1 n=1 Tax=Bicyclus anynana TaxID=110368 RepID=A0ABM3LME9_BICAN|nr:prostaglandin reductase 1-like [Bicyclus anynana]XP_052740251.1 prostaglandin reductase 1-like [Bicyclus anynana]